MKVDYNFSGPISLSSIEEMLHNFRTNTFLITSEMQNFLDMYTKRKREYGIMFPLCASFDYFIEHNTIKLLYNL